MTDASPITRANPILAKFRAALAEMYGDRLERVVLYGSRARGDARPDSDYDVAVFLRDMDDRFKEMHRLTEITSAILYDTGEFIEALPYSAASYNDPRMPLMYAIRTEGITL
ncbi:MAG TPA: nucleotidyltransferase domain-containing protein [Bryobacteraceae bacterium]|nr:nucleotidyltransferase domain-containing protein [Bryobacteraceae bacterium]